MIRTVYINKMIHKELNEKKIRLVLMFLCLPLLSGLFFIPHLYGWDDNFTEIISDLIPLYRVEHPLVPVHILSKIIYTDIYFPLFIFIPAFVSPFIGVMEGIISEKENRTLEVLFSLPLSNREILFGKMGGSMLSGIGLTWFIYIIHTVFYAVQFPYILLAQLFSVKWLMLTFILIPLISFTVNSLGMIMAIWVKKLSVAANLGLLVQSPFFLLVFLISFGNVVLNIQIIIFLIVLFLFGGVMFFMIAVWLFNRENLLLRYH